MTVEKGWAVLLNEDLEPEVKIYRLGRKLREEDRINASLWYAILEMRDARKGKFSFEEEPELPDYFCGTE